MQALAITLGVFVLILVLVRLRVPLAGALLLGSITLGLLMWQDPARVTWGILHGLTWPRTIVMMIITFLLLGLSTMMQKTGQFERLVKHACALLRQPSIAMAVMPALVGLQPMPGGALFSAPMVKAAADKFESRGAILSGINFWFRHIWESWWPLYLAVILAAETTNRSLSEFIPVQLPLGIFMAISGILILRKVHPDLHITQPKAPRGTISKMLWSMSSLILIAIIWVIVRIAIYLYWSKPAEDIKETLLLMAIRKYLPITIALITSIVWTACINRMKLSATTGNIFKNKKHYSLAVIVGSVMIFGYMLGVDQTNAGEKMAIELRDMNVPVMAIAIILPFIAGMVTGIAVGFVGISFGILVPLVLNANGLGHEAIPAYMMLAYSFGHLGQMMSPVHVCQIVSNQYFKTTFPPMYRQIIPPAILTASLTIAYFLLLRAF